MGQHYSQPSFPCCNHLCWPLSGPDSYLPLRYALLLLLILHSLPHLWLAPSLFWCLPGSWCTSLPSWLGPSFSARGVWSIITRLLPWAYILALIGVADAAVLAALAFTLAVRHVKLLS